MPDRAASDHGTIFRHLGMGWCETCQCLVPGSAIAGVEYAFDSPQHYDGNSEWVHVTCGRREGRWTHRELLDGDSEPASARHTTARPSGWAA